MVEGKIPIGDDSKDKPGANPVPDKKDIGRVRRSYLMTDMSPGNEVDAKGREKQTESSNQWIELDAKVHDQLADFLQNYVTRLAELNRTDPNILKDPAFASERGLLKLLTDEKGNVTNTDGKGEANDRVLQFLKNPKNWEIARMVQDRNTFRLMRGLGQIQQTSLSDNGLNLPGEQRMRTGVDQGLINRINYDYLQPNRDRIYNTVGGIAGSLTLANLGLENHGIPGLIIGGATLPVAKGLERLHRSATNEGVTYSTAQSPAAQLEVKTNPLEDKYLQLMHGIYVEDFRVDPADGQIKPREEGATRTRGIDKIQQEITNSLDSRKQYYAMLGVPEAKLQRFAGDFLFKEGSKNGLEDIRTNVQRRFGQEYNPNVEIKDVHGVGQGEPGFDANNIDRVGNIRRYEAAQERMLVKMVMEAVNEETGREKEKQTAVIDELGTKIDARTKDTGAAWKEATKDHSEAKTAIDETATKIKADKATFDTYSDALKAVEAARDELTVKFATIPGADIPEKKRYILGKLNKSTPPTGTSIEELLDAIEPTVEANIGRRHAALTTPPGKARDAQEASIAKDENARAEAKRARILKQKEEFEKQIADMEAAEKTLKESLETLKASQVAVTDVEKTVENLENDFSIVIGWGITDVELNDDSMDVLLMKINRFNTANPAHGWPESENNDPDRRTRLARAVIEAKAERRLALDTSRTRMRIDDYDRAITWGISENELRSLSTTQLLERINNIYLTSGGTRGFEPRWNGLYTRRMADAQTEAVERFNTRKAEMDLMEKDLTEASAELQKQIDSTDLSEDAERLQLVKNLLEVRQGVVFSESGKPVSEKDKKRFANQAKLRASDKDSATYSEAERNARAERAYYEYMDLLFGYKQSSDREAQFANIYKIMEPKKFARIMNTSLGLGLPDRANLTQVLAEIQTQVDSYDIDRTDMRKALEKVMDTIRDEALAMP